MADLLEIRRQAVMSATARKTLIGFALLGTVLIAAIPHLFSHNGRPPLSMMITVGTVIVALTVITGLLVYRQGMWVPPGSVILGLSYNAVIVAMKFVISPSALYAPGVSKTQFGNPNNILYQLGTTLGLLAMYLFALYWVYRMSERRFRHAMNDYEDPEQAFNKLPPQHLLNRTARRLLHGTVWSLAALLAIAAVVSGGVVLLFVLLMAAALLGGPITYLLFVDGSVWVRIVIAVAATFLLGVWSYHIAEKRAVADRNGIILPRLFYMDFLLICAYHVQWVVFMLMLVQIWPLASLASI